MEEYKLIIWAFLIPQVIAGIVGGFIGAWINSKLSVYGIRLTILFGVTGVVSAGAMAEYMFYEHNLTYLLIHCLLGIVTGIFGSSGVDALKINAPALTNDLVKDVGGSLKDRILSYIKRK